MAHLALRSRIAPLLGTLALAAVASVGASGIAHADFRVCNATQSLVGVAIGYRAQAGWLSERLVARRSFVVQDADRGAPVIQVLLHLCRRCGAGRTLGRSRVDVPCRIGSSKIAGTSDCFARGFQRAGFQEYDTGDQSSWMVQLTDEGPLPGATITGTGTQ